jgi:hypothetical protein
MQVNLHANNLQEQLRWSTGAFCRSTEFELNARKMTAQMAGVPPIFMMNSAALK